MHGRTGNKTVSFVVVVIILKARLLVVRGILMMVVANVVTGTASVRLDIFGKTLLTCRARMTHDVYFIVVRVVKLMLMGLTALTYGRATSMILMSVNVGYVSVVCARSCMVVMMSGLRNLTVMVAFSGTCLTVVRNETAISLAAMFRLTSAGMLR